MPLESASQEDPPDEEQIWDLTLPLQDRATLESALAELKPLERSALYLNVVEGYTAREIGDLLDLPRGTVLSLMYRGRQRLRGLLEHKEAMP